MESVPGCTQSRPGELGSGQCQSNAGAPGPEEEAVGGGKEDGISFCAFICLVLIHFAPVSCLDLKWQNQLQPFVITASVWFVMLLLKS